MGLLSDLAKSAEKDFPDRVNPSPEGRAIWREIFGATTKEDSNKFPPVQPPGGSWGRSVASTDAAQKRLIQALRSMAPGGWSDNRWEESKHLTGIVYTCVQRTCEMLAQSEFQVYIKDRSIPEGRRPVVPEDFPQGNRLVKPYDLLTLLEKPNNQDSWGDMVFRWVQQMSLTGVALTWMVPNELGTPMELYSIPTAIAIPQPAINPDFPDGYYRIQPVYPYGPFSTYPTPASAVGAAIPAQWMLRHLYPHPLLRYDGYSPLSALRLHIDEVESMDRSRWYSMKRTINPSAVLNFDTTEGMEPLPEPEIERIRAEFESSFMGPENTGQLFISSPGSKLEPWGARPVDMDYQAGWSQLVSFIMSGFGITKPAAGMVEDTSYSTLFATLKQFHLLTLEPMCRRFSSNLTRHLAPFFGDNLIIEISCKRIDDHDVTHARVNLLVGAFAVTKNEVRQEMGMPPTSEPWGAEVAGQPPMMPAGPGAFPAAPGIQTDVPGPAPTPGAIPEPQLPMGQVVAPDENSRGKIPGLSGLVAKSEMNREEPSPVMRNRSQPDKLGRGALGPRKSLEASLRNRGLISDGLQKEIEVQTKSFYDRVREVCRNGH